MSNQTVRGKNTMEGNGSNVW